MIFKEVISQHSVSEINNFAKANNLSFNMAKLLMQRGIDTDQKFIKFTSPCLQDLRDPFLLSGMRDCHNRIQKAIDKNERVLIFGDYDVDGISAVTIMHKFLKDKISNLFYFLPNRYEDGYGLSIDCSKKIIEQYNPQLIITVDCGISCEKEVEYIKSQGVDIIVTDHHEIPEILPSTIVVDPKLPNQQYGFDGLCGAGVAMKVIETFVGRDSLDEYLPVCAIATISDIVPLVDENRAIVKLGLKKQNLLPEGIKMLITECKIPDLNSQAVSFKLAPKLNATGRMGNAYFSLDLFISDDEQTLNNSLKKVIELNVTRQKLSQQIYDECIEIVKKE
ncbi:MAG: DHH family phosphoesterase, partial [Clostridia bacterium]|nr:DHH family phosphoesterase [Clostridia bacterium]